jgi:hypothetical protein
MKFYVIYRDIDLKGGSPCTVCNTPPRFPPNRGGLKNSGNHCYANAVLQMLRTATGLFLDPVTLGQSIIGKHIFDEDHVRRYRLFLQRDKSLPEHLKINDPDIGELIDYYRANKEKYKEMIDQEWNEEISTLISKLHPNNTSDITEDKRSCIRKQFPTEYSNQQDAREFLLYVLEHSYRFALLKEDFLVRGHNHKFTQTDCSSLKKGFTITPFNYEILILPLPHTVSVIKDPEMGGSVFEAEKVLTNPTMEWGGTKIKTDGDYYWVFTEKGSNVSLTLMDISKKKEVPKRLWGSIEILSKQVTTLKRIEKQITLTECLYYTLSCHPAAFPKPTNRAVGDVDFSDVKSVKLIITTQRYIFISLVIYNNFGNKINPPVSIDTPITINESRYDVIAVVYHRGSTIHGGHYTCKAKRSDGKIYYYDDNEEVKTDNFDPPRGFTPYLVLCERLPS